MTRYIQLTCPIPACEWTMIVDTHNPEQVSMSYNSFIYHQIFQHPEILTVMIELTHAPST